MGFVFYSGGKIQDCILIQKDAPPFFFVLRLDCSLFLNVANLFIYVDYRKQKYLGNLTATVNYLSHLSLVTYCMCSQTAFNLQKNYSPLKSLVYLKFHILFFPLLTCIIVCKISYILFVYVFLYIYVIFPIVVCDRNQFYLPFYLGVSK